jgi:hypothetical protein
MMVQWSLCSRAEVLIFIYLNGVPELAVELDLVYLTVRFCFQVAFCDDS